jgi:hypothetical protein
VGYLIFSQSQLPDQFAVQPEDLRRASVFMLFFLLFMLAYFLTPQIVLAAEVSRIKWDYQRQCQRKLQDLIYSGELPTPLAKSNFADLAQHEASLSGSGVLPANFPAVFKPMVILVPSLLSLAEKVFKTDNNVPIALQNLLGAIWKALGF